MPEFQRTLGASIGEVSIIVAAFGIARLFVDLPIAGLATRLGARPLLLAGTGAVAAAYGGASLAPGMAGLVLAQAVAGVGSALCHVTSLTVLGVRSTPERSGRTMGRYFVATFGGLTVAGPLSGYVAAYAGWRASLLVAAGSALVALVLTLATLPGTEPAPAAAAGGPRATWDAVLRPRLWSVYFLHFTALFLWAGVRGTLWPMLASTGGFTVDAIGTALGFGALVSLGALHLGGILADRQGKRPIIIIGLLASVVGIGLLVAPSHAVLLLLSLGLQDLGQGFIASNASALLTDVLRGPGIGLGTGVMRLVADVGWLAGPLALGGMAGRVGFGTATAVAMLVPLASLLALARQRPDRTEAGRPAGPATRSRQTERT